MELSQSIGTLHEDHEKVLVGIKSNDDASVYALDANTALVQSVDFITPVVDDPFTYGQIAAANSLSDIYAMGSSPINALNLVGFDTCNLNKEILSEILAGGLDKIKESGAVLTGGHTIETEQMYYGLSATGLTHPQKIWRNNTPKVGDLLILTKPLGTGVVATAIKGEMADEKDIKEASFYMSRLNRYAFEVLKDFKPSACTDVTGFGLLGHALEMAGNDVSLELYEDKIPLLSSAVSLANMGLIPEGSYKNFDYVSRHCSKKPDMLLCDAQTSGGLLVAVDAKEANDALKRIRENGDERAEIVGSVCDRKDRVLMLK